VFFLAGTWADSGPVGWLPLWSRRGWGLPRWAGLLHLAGLRSVLRNKANLGAGRFRVDFRQVGNLPHFGGLFGFRRNKANFPGGGFQAEAAELGQGAEVLAFQGIELAEDAVERGGAESGAVGAGENVGGLFAGKRAENVGLEANEAAAHPVAVDEGIDQVTRDRDSGLVVVEVAGGESVEFVLAFTGDDEDSGVDAVLEGVEADGDFALGGARPSGPLSVEAIGLGLALRSHVDSRLAGERAEFEAANMVSS